MARARWLEARPWAAAGALLGALLTAVVALEWWAGRVLSFDALGLFSPYYTLIADLAAAGQLLLWDPWSNCGSPAHAYVEMGSFSPLLVAHAWLTGGGHLGFQLYALTIWLIGGLGWLALARHLGAPVWGGLVVALSLACSGFQLGHATHVSWLYSFSFLPWLLSRVDSALARARWWPCVEAGALYGLSALAGHPALVILNGMFLAGWAAARVAAGDLGEARTARFEPRAAARAGVALAIVLAVGVVVLSPAYAAFLVDAAGYADRVGALERSVAVSDQRLYPSAIATIASPYLPRLAIADRALWPGTWVGLCANYVGPTVPALAILALVTGTRRRFRIAVAALGLLFLACAVGDSLPLRGWLYDLVPPTRYFRHTAVFRGYFLAALGVLALLGSREIAAAADRVAAWRRLAWIGAALVVPMLVAFEATLRSASAVAVGLPLGNLHWALAWVGTPALIGIALRRSARAPAIALVLWMIGDGAVSLVQSAPIRTSVHPGLTADAALRDHGLDLARRGLFRDAEPRSAAGNRQLLTKVPIVESFSTLNSHLHTRSGLGSASWQNLGESWSDVPVLRRAASGEVRTWFATEVLELAPSDEAFGAVVARAVELRAPPLVIHARSEMSALGAKRALAPDVRAQIAALPAAQPIAVALEEYGPRALAFSVDAPAAGWLLVTDRWARGWSARVDGQPVELWAGDFLFRALPLGAGRHQVAFRFDPFLYPWLVIASWGTLALVAVLCAWRRHGQS